MEYKKLVAPSLQELFVKEMAEKIISGEMKAGDRFPPERELTKLFGVSRTVTNRGIQELARCGFVEIVPRKGVFVADYRRQGTMDTLPYVLEYNKGKFDPEMLSSIYAVRCNIESHIVRLAADNRTAEDVTALYAQVDRIEHAADAESFGEAVHVFYHLLAITSKNIIYPLNIQAYHDIYVSLTAKLYPAIPPARRAEQLKALVRLIERGDAAAAERCVVHIAEWGMETLSAEYAPGQRY